MSFRSSVLLGLLLLSGCEGSQTASMSGDSDAPVSYPIEVVCTVGMVADLVRNVGGEHVNVTQMIGSGVDPHLHKATRDDVAKLMQADIVLYSGLMLEGKMVDTLVNMARKKPVAPVTEGLPADVLLEPDSMGGHMDPHAWMDVSAWSHCVGIVAAELSAFDPQHASDYSAAAAAYQAKLAELHQYGVARIASIPADSRVLITSHDAFNYFGRAYGIEVLGVQGLSTESEAGLQRINELVDLIVSRKIRAVFVESSVSSKNIEALIEGAATRGQDVVIGGELFSDAMGAQDTYEGTYVGMLDHNITLVARGLGGEAPELGMQGKLGEK